MKKVKTAPTGNRTLLTPTQSRQIRGGVVNPELRPAYVDCPDLRTATIGLKISAVQARF